jgi:hypothetical protein
MGDVLKATPAMRLSPKGRQQRTVQECVTLRPPLLS